MLHKRAFIAMKSNVPEQIRMSLAQAIINYNTLITFISFIEDMPFLERFVICENIYNNFKARILDVQHYWDMLTSAEKQQYSSKHKTITNKLTTFINNMETAAIIDKKLLESTRTHLLAKRTSANTEPSVKRKRLQ